MLEKIIERIQDIQSSQENTIIFVGIDGGGGSGKSTLTDKIATALKDVQIIHMDDFYKLETDRKMKELAKAPVGYEFDIERLISQVIIPLASNNIAEYQIYDWLNDRLSSWRKVYPIGIIIIEGCYSIIDTLSPFYHVKIFVDCDRAVRLKRGLGRDGESALPFWINWMDGEDKYFAEQCIKENADFIYVSDSTV